MSEIKVNDYIRTIEGKIDKVINNNYYMPAYIECEKGIILREKIKNNKEKPIDLIEEGDYVNGMLVRKGRVANGEEKLLVGNHIIHGMALKVVNIKSIVTHEQFKNIEYKVGE